MRSLKSHPIATSTLIGVLISSSSSSGFVDLISATLIAPSQSVERRQPQQPECDENNNNSNSASSVDAEKPSSVSINDDERDEKSEKIKPKQMVGLFPLDLRSELKSRLGGKGGFALKKSSTSFDVRKQEAVAASSVPILIPNNNNNNNDLSTMMKKKKLIDKDDNDNEEDAGVENLSFKEKLQLIERSSSRSLINPL